MLKCRDGYRDECCENRFEPHFEFKCVFESRFKGHFEYGFEYGLRACIQVCLHAERECCVRAMGNQSLTRTTLLRCRKTTSSHNGCRKGKTSRIVAIGENAILESRSGKQERFSWKHVFVQKRECLPKVGARLKHDRIDDDAEDERNKKVSRECLFPPYYTNPGISLR